VSSFVENQAVKTLSMDEVKPAVVSLQSRIANIERLRIISAFGVASFHVHDWFPRSLGVAGFIILLLSYCAFVVNKPEPYGIARVAKRKAQRLLKPWLFWSIVYAGLGFAIGRIKILQRNDRKKYFVLVILLTMAACAASMVLARFSYGTWFDFGEFSIAIVRHLSYSSFGYGSLLSVWNSYTASIPIAVFSIVCFLADNIYS